MMKDTDTECLDRFLCGKSGAVAKSPSARDGGVLPVGTMLGDWRVTSLIGRGGSGEVYRVVRVTEPMEAAAKILIGDDEAVHRRFLDEIDFLSNNRLRQFPRYFARGRYDGRDYLVLELLEPLDLPTSERGVAAYMTDVCACVRALHLSGFVHRDLKPTNIMRRKNGEVVLIDFGLAKDVCASAWPRKDVSVVSRKVVGVGTWDYAAPEQLTGGEISPATDIHALGRIANIAFGGKPPRAWATIIRRATSSISAQRYETIEDFEAAIHAISRKRWVAVGCVAAVPLVAVALLLPFGPFGIGRHGAVRNERSARVPEVVRIDGGQDPAVVVEADSDGANPIGTALGDPQRIWMSGGTPSRMDEDVRWHAHTHDESAGRNAYVGSGGGGAGVASSYLCTWISGPCKVGFEYSISTYKGDAVVLCGKQEMMHFKGIADASFGWKEAVFDIPKGDHLLSFVYVHPGRGFIDRFNGFRIANFRVIPAQ